MLADKFDSGRLSNGITEYDCCLLTHTFDLLRAQNGCGVTLSALRAILTFSILRDEPCYISKVTWQSRLSLSK
jgi:hypothetical protein